MTIPNKSFLTGMHQHQRDVFKAFDNGQARFFVLEWARRHRKTTLSINLLIRECCRYPNSKYVYVAPTQVMARNIVWDDPTMLSNALPDKEEMDWKKNEQKMQVKFANGSILKIGGSDEPDSLRGIDAIGVIFDEWALIKENTWTEIFRPIIAGPCPPHLKGQGVFRWAMFLYTPKGINHATLMFDKACCLPDGGTLPDCGMAGKMADGWYVSRLDGEKAGIMSDVELALAKEDMPKVIYDQEIRCSRTTQEERTLITTEMIDGLEGVNWELTNACRPDIRQIVSIDPAFGGDLCDIIGMENGRILSHRTYHPHMTNEIILEAKRIALEIKTSNFIVDCIGNGKGVADGLNDDAACYNVQYFNSSETWPKDDSRKSLFYNRKAEAYYHTSEQIRKLLVNRIDSQELKRQLPVASRYNIRAGRILMLEKDKVKEDLGCSPDFADNYVYANYGLMHVEPVEPGRLVEEAPGQGVYVPFHIGAR